MRSAQTRGALLVLGACLFAFGAGAQAPEVPPQGHAYKAIHSLALTVKDLPAARAKVEAALKASGASDTLAPENKVGSDKVGYAQWSWAVPAKSLEKLLKRLRRLGKVTRDVRQANTPAAGTPSKPDQVLLNLAVDGPPVPEKK